MKALKANIAIISKQNRLYHTAWKVSKYGVFLVRILVIFHAVSPSPLVSWEAVKSYYFHILWYISYDTYLISYVYTIHYIFFDRKRTFVGSYDYHRYRPWYMVYVKNLFTFFGGVSRTLQSIYDGAFLKKEATVFSCYFRKVS